MEDEGWQGAGDGHRAVDDDDGDKDDSGQEKATQWR